MIPLSRLLRPYIRAHQLEPGLLSLRLQAEWEQLVGIPIAAHSYPKEIRRETLMVVVDSPIWSQELSLLKAGLLERINALGERPLLRQIRFQVGEFPKTPPPAPPAGKAQREAISEEEIQVDGVSDPDLIRQIRRLLSRALSHLPPEEGSS